MCEAQETRGSKFIYEFGRNSTVYCFYSSNCPVRIPIFTTKIKSHPQVTFCFWRRCGDSNPRSLVKDLHDFQSCSFGQLGHICKYCFDIITYQSKKSNNYLALFLTSSSFAKYTEREVKAKSIFISSAIVLTSQLNFDLKVR